MQELKPCPFCGGMPEINQRGDACGVFCNCNFTSHMQTYGGNEAEAVKRWNTRTPVRESSDDVIDALQRIVNLMEAQTQHSKLYDDVHAIARSQLNRIKGKSL